MINYSEADFDITALGSFYYPEKTVFRVFAPESKGVNLIISNQSFSMHKKGYCYEIAIGGNLEGYRYVYRHADGTVFKDPFAYYSDSDYSYILNPKRFISEKVEVKKKKKTVIYETSVRDFSCDESFPNDIRRKFLSLTLENLKINNYYMVGLDYIKNLGVSHIQLLPVFDYDLDKTDYNWGYNPLAYNLIYPEYVLHKDNPYAHINELRKTVNALHGNDLKVVLDVVFNHVYRPALFDLEKMVKGHVFRVKKDGKLANGTFCGNEVKSEDPFVRAYIVEMSKRYVDLFDIDGLRMDLMGILDYETVNLLKKELTKKKADFIIYGEGWNMGDVLSEDKRASLNNASKMKHIGMFNDFFRETMINALVRNDINIKNIELILTGDDNNLTSERSINYVECHDNNTFFDRLMIERGDESLEMCIDKCKLAIAMTLLAKGIPFIHSGQEFLRTKQLVENSYNAPEEINKIDWNRRVKYNDIADYTKALVELRNRYDFDGHASFDEHAPVLVYRIGELKIYINISKTESDYELGGQETLIFDGNKLTDESVSGLHLSPYSLMICV